MTTLMTITWEHFPAIIAQRGGIRAGGGRQWLGKCESPQSHCNAMMLSSRRTFVVDQLAGDTYALRPGYVSLLGIGQLRH